MARTWFWDRFAKIYSRQKIGDDSAYQKKLEITRQYVTADMSVFEFGCGTGSTAILHAPYVRHIHATDCSNNMLAIGRERARAAGVSNITFEQGDIEAMHFEGNTYDAVLGLNILHLLEDRDAALAQVFKMLKPGGHFISSTACDPGANPFLRGLLTVGSALRVLPLVKFFSVEDWLGAMRKAGFDVEYQWCPKPDASLFAVLKKPA
ncbi:MAG: class I SAM-dependent methyltransferase [Parvibaculum sp.]